MCIVTMGYDIDQSLEWVINYVNGVNSFFFIICRSAFLRWTRRN